MIVLRAAETAEVLARQARTFNTRLQDGSQRPAQWQKDLSDGLTQINSALQAVASPADLPGIPEAYEVKDVIADFRAYAGNFSCALKAWPDIRESAQKVCENMLATGALTA